VIAFNLDECVHPVRKCAE
jgi:hypothetical protein